MSTIKTNQIAHTANGASTYTLPQTDGSAGDYLQTNGSGVLSWVTPTAADNTPIFLVKLGSNQQHSPTNSWQLAQLNTAVFDASSVWDTTNYKFTVPSGKAGKYLLYYSQQIADNPDDGENMQGRITKTSGGTVTHISESYSIAMSPGSNKTTRISHTFATELAVGDELQMYLYQHSGGSANYQDYVTFFGGYRLIGT